MRAWTWTRFLAKRTSLVPAEEGMLTSRQFGSQDWRMSAEMNWGRASGRPCTIN